MERITESEVYAELVERHRRPMPVQPGDITVEQFARDTGSSMDVARNDLDAEVKAGRLVRVKRASPQNRPMNVYRVVDVLP